MFALYFHNFSKTFLYWKRYHKENIIILENNILLSIFGY